MAEVLAKDGGALLRADLAEFDLFAAAPPAEGRLTRGTSIPNPAHLPVGRNQPALAVLNQDDRCRVCAAASAARHTKKVGMSTCDTDAKQTLHEYVDQAGRTRSAGLRHPSRIAQADARHDSVVDLWGHSRTLAHAAVLSPAPMSVT